MIKKSKVILFITLIFILTVCTGCGDSINTSNESQKKGNELMNYIEIKDEEGLKSMFCNITASSINFDEQIQSALDFIDGEIISYNEPTWANESKEMKSGKTALLRFTPSIKNIETDTGRVYEIFFSYYIINSDENKVGITKLTIKTSDYNWENNSGEICTVGEYID